MELSRPMKRDTVVSEATGPNTAALVLRMSASQAG